MTGITNNLDTTRSQTFTYDQLNRLTGALTSSTYATSPSHCWGETYSLDAWGNLNSIAQTTNSAYTGCSEESGFSTTADGKNHLPSWAYDAAGNATSDGTVTNYQWDAESQLKSTPITRITMKDARWPGSQGWVKMSQTVNGVEIHWVQNTITGAVDDFKFAH